MLRRREFLMAPMAATALLASATGAAPPARRFDRRGAASVARSGPGAPGRLLRRHRDRRSQRQPHGGALRDVLDVQAGAGRSLPARVRPGPPGPLAQILPYSEADLLPWAPVTGRNLASGGMSIAALARAAQELSDGVAANLLVKRLGGRAGRRHREAPRNGRHGDPSYCYEPDLGLVLSADLRDTTSPLAMAQLVRRITTGDLLKGGSREHLLLWMQNTGTGPHRLRAGLPVGVAYREQDRYRTNGRNYQQVQRCRNHFPARHATNHHRRVFRQRRVHRADRASARRRSR